MTARRILILAAAPFIVHAESLGLSGFCKDRRPELILQKRLP